MVAVPNSLDVSVVLGPEIWVLFAETPEECIPLGAYSNPTIAAVELGLKLAVDVQWETIDEGFMFLVPSGSYAYYLLPMTVDQPPLSV